MAKGLLTNILEIIIMMVISLFSAAVAYLNKVKAGQEFKMAAFIINMLTAILMAFFIDSLVIGLYPDYNQKLEMAMMVIVGISSNKLLEFLEEKGLAEILSRLRVR